MNLASVSNPLRGGNGSCLNFNSSSSLADAFCGARQEKQARPKTNRTLSDITNITAQGLGHQGSKRPFLEPSPLLEPKTPARRSKMGASGSGLAVFDDGQEEWTQSAARRPASPPQVRPKSRGSDPEDGMLDFSRSMFGIEEVVEAELPPIQDFADRVTEQEHYWEAFGCSDGPDGFGRPEDLARMLGEGTARACFEAEGTSDLNWEQVMEGRGVMSPGSPGSSELNRMAWPSLSPSPKRKLADLDVGSAFGLSSSPLLPPMHIDMDIDSGSDG